MKRIEIHHSEWPLVSDEIIKNHARYEQNNFESHRRAQTHGSRKLRKLSRTKYSMDYHESLAIQSQEGLLYFGLDGFDETNWETSQLNILLQRQFYRALQVESWNSEYQRNTATLTVD